ncbi:MAG: 2-oxoglutarate and iron-dependent oxygenase domain-containing protein [Pseudomonadota bacterium]
MSLAPQVLQAAGLEAAPIAFSDLPLIDLSPMGAAPVERQGVADALREACIGVGFFYVTGHGVNPAVRAKAFEMAEAFFDLPQAEKDKVSNKHSPIFRGYTGLMEENTDPANRGDLHEAFDLSLDLGPDDPDAQRGIYGWGPNLWPARPDGFRHAMMAYHAEMLALSARLYRAFALALHLPEDFFTSMLTKPVGELRLLHYPNQPAPEPDVIGIGAHTDYDTFTILATDDVSALQVQNADGAWVAAPPRPDTFIVNVGDLLQRWTNDIFRSTLHRAVNVSGRRRFSMPFFSSVNPLQIVEVLPSCVSAERPARYEPVAVGAYIEARMAAAYGT